VCQNTVESVLLEDRERKDQLLVVDVTERMGVYGAERLPKDRNPRPGIVGVFIILWVRSQGEIDRECAI
jgi:hypothetical protein